MAVKTEYIVRRELRSPRSAAVAGIIFSILMITILFLTRDFAKVKAEDITRQWLESYSSTVSLVLTLVPFAGIAFLWFTGVIRDRLGEYEDRLFSTIFLSSGIITVLLLFIWGATFGAILDISSLAAVLLANRGTYLYSSAFMNLILGNYTLRMAGVYMTAIGTIWIRTDLMPRWITIITYILALGFLFAAPNIRVARYVFPAWVFVVSFYILILNFRATREQESEELNELRSHE